MARVVNSRIRLLLLCILLVFAALLARASWIATVRASSLSQMAQTQTKATVVLPAGRGTIFDSMGSPLALGEQATTVYADPSAVTKPQQEARVAARVLGLPAGLQGPLANILMRREGETAVALTTALAIAKRIKTPTHQARALEVVEPRRGGGEIFRLGSGKKIVVYWAQLQQTRAAFDEGLLAQVF